MEDPLPEGEVHIDEDGHNNEDVEPVKHAASQSDDGVEVGIKILRGMYRTLKLCLESRIGK